jgi:hypothetical protein
MKKPIEELKEKGSYRAVAIIHGEIKSKFLKDCEKGEKPADIVRQALRKYYSNDNRF